MASLLNVATVLTQSLKADGTINAGGKVYLFQVGTSTPLATYTDSTLSTQNAHPVILDSSGYANIWINADADISVRDANDVVIRTATKINPTQAAGTSLLNSNNSWSGTNSFTNTTTVLDATITNAPVTAGQLQAGGLNFVQTSGTVPNYTATLPLLPSETVFTTGANFRIQFHAAPTTGLVTLNVNGTGAIPLYYNGAQINGVGPIVIGDIWDIVYGGVGPIWYLFDVTSAGNNTFTGTNAFAATTHTTINSKIANDLVTGPASSTNAAVAQFNGTTGKVVANGPTYDTAPNANALVQRDSAGFILNAVGDSGATPTKVATEFSSNNRVHWSTWSNFRNNLFTPSFTSSVTTTPVNALITIAHGQGAIPHIWKVFLQCTSTEAGYNAGDRIDITSIFGDSSRYITTSVDATNIYIRFNGFSPSIVNRSTGAVVALALTGNDLTNWGIRVLAWKL